MKKLTSDDKLEVVYKYVREQELQKAFKKAKKEKRHKTWNNVWLVIGANIMLLFMDFLGLIFPTVVWCNCTPNPVSLAGKIALTVCGGALILLIHTMLFIGTFKEE